MGTLLQLTVIGKRYGRGPAVLTGVDLQVGSGRVLGIAGANGSGKSTLLRIIAGLSRPSVGRVDGTATIGYLPDRFPAAQRMSAGNYLRHMARIRGLPDPSVVDTLLDRLSLVGGPKAPMAQLSKGNAQKVGLAQAILGDPKLLILDEPWSGLDIDAHQVLAEIVAEARARCGSVVFTDHRAEHVRRHSDGAYLMTDGRIAVDTESTAPQPIPADPPPAQRVRIVLMGTAASALSGDPGVLAADTNNGSTVLTVERNASDAILLTALRRGWSVREVAPCLATGR